MLLTRVSQMGANRPPGGDFSMFGSKNLKFVAINLSRCSGVADEKQKKKVLGVYISKLLVTYTRHSGVVAKK